MKNKKLYNAIWRFCIFSIIHVFQEEMLVIISVQLVKRYQSVNADSIGTCVHKFGFEQQVEMVRSDYIKWVSIIKQKRRIERSQTMSGIKLPFTIWEFYNVLCTWRDEEGFPQLFVSSYISNFFRHIHQPTSHWRNTAEIQDSVTNQRIFTICSQAKIHCKL